MSAVIGASQGNGCSAVNQRGRRNPDLGVARPAAISVIKPGVPPWRPHCEV
jgi:hypothetical protein